ncbi:MAG: diguanylate cyclase [Chloroflexota bacterium]
MKPDRLNRQFEALLRLSEARSLPAALDLILRQALELYDAGFGYLALLQNDGGLDFVQCRDRAGQALEPPQEKAVYAALQEALDARQGRLVEDILAEALPRGLRQGGARRRCSVLCAPLAARSTLHGALLAAGEPAAYDLDDLALFSAYAAQAAAAIENARQNDQLDSQLALRTNELQELATSDPLTGIFNRRHFFTMAEQAFELARRYDQPLTMLRIDIDHFKPVNDRYGHTTGDQALRLVAQVLARELRAADIFGRIGGEEFAAFLPHTHQEEALLAAQRLRQAVEMLVLPAGADMLRLTTSIGVVEYDARRDSGIDDLIAKADQALSEAKRAGRNTVRYWPPA